MDGGDRAGYKEIAKSVDATLIAATTGISPCTGDWVSFEIVSTAAIIKSITAPGMTNSSLITTAESHPQGTVFACSKITVIDLSTKLPTGKAIAHKRILI